LEFGKEMRQVVSQISVIALILLLNSCNTTDPPPPPSNGEKPTLELTLEDVSCTEAWIELTATNLQLPITLTLKQFNPTGDTLSKVSILNTQDSLLYIDSLLPNQTYSFKASHSGLSGISSNELSVTTMDTTSHDFTFETYTFGSIGSSTLYDVAIINENNIWAVGEILVADTSQNGYTTYNAVHWDGSDWQFKRIMFYTICGQQHQNAYAASSIFSFSENDIWVGMQGSQIARLNDTTQISTQCIPISVRKLWGTDSQNLYAVGINGQIAHYNGTNWQRIESGTELDFHDIYGATLHTGEEQILAVCSRNLPLDKGIYKIQENIAAQISSDPIQWELYALWFISNRHYYVIGNGIYEKTEISNILWTDNGFDITHYATTGIRGNGLNDVFISGAFGEFLHFNGVTWKSYINETGWFSGSYGGIAVRNNLVITVGYEGAEAKILMGYRQ
jgi:hypothetical protein